MGLQDIDTTLLVAGDGATVILVVALLFNGLYRQFPIFTGFLTLTLISDLLLYEVRSHSPGLYFNSYLVMNGADYLLQMAVLFEIGAKVVSPVKRSLPVGVLWILAGLLIAAAALTVGFAVHSTPHSLSHVGVVFVKLNLGMALLRLGIFVAIAVFAQMLGIGWKNHVLQLATGLAFYSAISLLVASAQSTVGLTYLFHPLAQIQVASYDATVVFWIWSFVRQEDPRKQFTPQMQRFLLSIAGSTRSDRLALKTEILRSANRKR